MKNLLIQAFDEPNHTQTPNKFFDMIPDMGEAELRVTLVMIRHTLGYHKNTFKMGMQKLGDASGLTRQGAIAGAEAAEQRGIFKRSNPDSQKEAEWELNLLPVNVDDMSTSLTSSVNVDDTKCNPRLQQSPIKESIKEINKDDVIFQANKKMDAYLGMMSDSPGIKREARINDILSYLGVTFRRNTSTKEWLTFAKYIDSEFQSKGWDVKQFVSWLFGQKDYNPNYWPVKKMMEFYPSAFSETPTVSSMFETLT